MSLYVLLNFLSYDERLFYDNLFVHIVRGVKGIGELIKSLFFHAVCYEKFYFMLFERRTKVSSTSRTRL